MLEQDIHDITAEQARKNMESSIHGPQEAIDSLNAAIKSASEEHRGETVVFLSRDHLSADDLEKVIRHFQSRGFEVDDRCHDRHSFAIKIRWYPGQRPL